MQESKLARTLYIDRAVYRVDDRMKTYQYLHRNPEWERLSRKRNEANKKAIDGYTRVFRDGRTRTYKRPEHP